MHISGLTSSQVWLSSSRSLTNFGSGALAQTSSVNTVLAGGASVDLRTSSGVVGFQTIVVVTGASATGSMIINLWDGTTVYQLAASAASPAAQATASSYTTAGVGPRILNGDATHAGSYEVAGISLTI